MTREVIAKMPEHIVTKIEMFRKDYANAALSADTTRARIAGYVEGLRDAGMITDRERQVLFCYATV